MSYIDTGDIKYQVPIVGGEINVPASYDQYRQTAPTDASPVINDKPEIPKERIIRGRTVTFEGITYVFLAALNISSLISMFKIFMIGFC